MLEAKYQESRDNCQEALVRSDKISLPMHRKDFLQAHLIIATALNLLIKINDCATNDHLGFVSLHFHSEKHPISRFDLRFTSCKHSLWQVSLRHSDISRESV